jgi:hypothetical protein
MRYLALLLDYLFGCHHPNLSRVFTIGGQTYKICCDCGAKFHYSLKTMSVEREARRAAPAIRPVPVWRTVH